MNKNLLMEIFLLAMKICFHQKNYCKNNFFNFFEGKIVREKKKFGWYLLAKGARFLLLIDLLTMKIYFFITNNLFLGKFFLRKKFFSREFF